MGRVAAGVARAWRRLLAPPVKVGWVTCRLASGFTTTAGGAASAFYVADNDRLAALCGLGALAGLLWWWAEHRIRAAYAEGHRAGTRDTLAVMAEASAAASAGGVFHDRGDDHE